MYLIFCQSNCSICHVFRRFLCSLRLSRRGSHCLMWLWKFDLVKVEIR